jgi:IS6 family transposase
MTAGAWTLTYVRVKGKWRYLYRAVDSSGRDPRLSPLGQAGRGRSKALSDQSVGTAAPSRAASRQHRQACGLPAAIVQLKDEGVLEENCQHRPVQYLNNVLEQDHRAIKRRINASQHFRSFWELGARRAGYEAIHMIRKGQACWSAMGTGSGSLHRSI